MLLLQNEALGHCALSDYAKRSSCGNHHIDQLIATSTSGEAEILEKDKLSLKQEYLGASKASYRTHNGEKNLITSLIRSDLLLDLFTVLLFLMKLINKRFNKLIDFILKWHRLFKGVKIKNIEIQPEKQDWQVKQSITQ